MRPRYSVEVVPPELAKEIDKARADYMERTGRTPLEMTRLFLEEEEACNYARNLSQDNGELVYVYLRYGIEE